MKTIKQVEITPVFTDLIPESKLMAENVVYVSLLYHTAVHLCLCGCKYQSVTPLTKDGWKMNFDNSKLTLSPSILNGNCPNKSHYIITKNIANFV